MGTCVGGGWLLVLPKVVSAVELTPKRMMKMPKSMVKLPHCVKRFRGCIMKPEFIEFLVESKS